MKTEYDITDVARIINGEFSDVRKVVEVVFDDGKRCIEIMGERFDLPECTGDRSTDQAALLDWLEAFRLSPQQKEKMK